MSKANILVIEDDLELNHLIVKSLEKENMSCESAYDGIEAEKAIKEHSYDLVILDLMLPHIDGLDILAKIRKHLQIPVLILSAKGEETDKVIGLGLGADDYMTKPFSIVELKARVKAHVRRYINYDNNVQHTNGDLVHFINQGDLYLNLHTYQCRVRGVSHDLKGKEFEILKLFMKHPNRVFTKSQIYEHVWKDSYVEDENTVMVHIRRIRKKIENDPSNPKYIKTVWGIGYKLGDGS